MRSKANKLFGRGMQVLLYLIVNRGVTGVADGLLRQRKFSSNLLVGNEIHRSPSSVSVEDLPFIGSFAQKSSETTQQHKTSFIVHASASTSELGR